MRSRRSPVGWGAAFAVAGVLLLPSPVAAGRDVPPVRVGPVVTIATGPGWSLTGWQNSAHRVCLSYRVPSFRWQTVQFCGPSDTMLTSLWTYLPESSSEVLVVGAVKPDVTRVEARAGDGKAMAVSIFTAPAALQTHLRFFRVLLRKGSPPFWHVTAYDTHGVQVGVVHQGQPVPSSSGTVATGTFRGGSWKLTATDSADGSYCITMTPTARRNDASTACGSIFRRGGHGISYLSHTGPPLPNYIVGPVVATARVVQITLSTGEVLGTATLAPPASLSARIAFYRAELSCGVYPTRIVALDRAGHTVAHLDIRLRPVGKPRCST